MHEMVLSVVLHPFSELVNAGMMRYLVESGPKRDAINQVKQKYHRLLEGVQRQTHSERKTEPLVREVIAGLKVWFKVAGFNEQYPTKNLRGYKRAVDRLSNGLTQNQERWGAVFGWLFTRGLGKVVRRKDYQELSGEWLEEWLLVRRLAAALEGMGYSPENVWQGTELVKILLRYPLAEECIEKKPVELVESWFSDHQLQTWLQVNRFQDVLWFNKEAFEEWLWWALAMSTFTICSDKRFSPEEVPKQFMSVARKLEKVRKAVKGSDYQVDKLLSLLGSVK